MTSKDKTRQRLVGSMRKTKAVAGIGTDNAETETAVAGSEVPQSAKPAVGKASGSGSSLRPKKVDADSYQNGRRVWPD
jgi:hypothetical protein